jgi:SAM-dependent MidA family methyltransferase
VAPRTVAQGILAVLTAGAGKSKRLRFDEYQRIALYDAEHGFFARDAGRAGRGGDFLTSPEVAPLFAECIAHALAADAATLDGAEFHVVDAGAGRGSLVRDLWQTIRFHPLGKRIHFHLLEISAAARAQHPSTLKDVPRERWTSHARLEDLPSRPWDAGAIVANELFDNLPVRRVMMGKELQEIVVRVTPKMLREELVAAPIELQAYLEAQGVRLVTGQTAEVCLEAPEFLARLSAHFRRSSAILVDYGDAARHLYDAARFPHGTLATHRGHTTTTEFYAQPGEHDLTAHVNFTPLRETLEAAGHRVLFFGSQMRFLLDHGLAEALQRRQAAAADDFERLRWSQWAKQLYHPDVMGEAFRVLHTRAEGPTTKE